MLKNMELQKNNTVTVFYKEYFSQDFLATLGNSNY